MEKLRSHRAEYKYAGAFIAWVIGSGFATGQEVMQFFTGYGYMSYAVVLVNLLGFLLIGRTLMVTGYEHRGDSRFNQFRFFCGERLGAFYTWLVAATILLLMSVLISGAGATLREYYGVNHYIGAALMAVMVLCAYLTGFQRLVRVVSKLGPVIIAFSVAVGLLTVLRDRAAFAEVPRYEAELSALRATPSWFVSALLYLSLNFLTGSTYYTQLGASAESQRDARNGALLGAGALVLCIAIVNTAILLNADKAASLSIPVLYLARSLSPVLGAVFSVVLVLGMFSSCSAMMWTICSRLRLEQRGHGRIAALGVAAAAFALGLLPFGDLIAVFYPIVGYVGLIFIACVAYRGLRSTLGK